MILEKVSRVTVVDSVTERLISLITEGHIKPGERLPSEQSLMEQLQVGRSSVREALRGLALVGIVESRPRRGTVVVSPVATSVGRDLRNSITYWALKDLFEVRALLEGHAVAKAAGEASADELNAIKDAATKVEMKVDVGASYFTENERFHLAIAEAGHNPVLLKCLSSIINSLRDVRERMNTSDPDNPRKDVEDHRLIVDAICERDAAAARKLMVAHLQRGLGNFEPQQRTELPAKKETVGNR